MLERPPSVGPDAVRAVAANIFIHSLPAMLTDLVRRAHPVGLHQFQLIGEAAADLAPGLAEDDRRVVLSSAFIDVSDEPVVLRLPHTHGRFFNLTLIDAVGEPFESLGSRTGDDAGANLALVGPDWRGELPAGLRAKRAPGASIWAVSRIHAHSLLDGPDAVKIAERLCVAALGPERRSRSPAKSVLEPPASPCVRQLGELAPAMFFHRLETVLKRTPAAFRAVEGPLIANLLRELGGPPDPAEWPADFAHALAGGLAEGMKTIAAAAVASDAGTSGWWTRSRSLNESPSSPLVRAAFAFASLGAPVREDVLALACALDEGGSPLSGAHVYRIHFASNGLPPVNAFWRLAAQLRGGESGPELGNRSNLTPNADGSCDVYIQRHAPGIDRIGNWLPTGDGPIRLIMQLYSPRPAAVSGSWRMPPVQRVDSGGQGPRTSRRSALSYAARPRYSAESASL